MGVEEKSQADEIPDDPPGRGNIAFLPISDPPAAAEVEAACERFFRDTDEPWPLIRSLFGEAHAEAIRARMAAALTAAGNCCSDR